MPLASTPYCALVTPCFRWPQSKIGEQNPDIFYTDMAGYRNRECLSLGCDEEAVLAGRTPVEVYSDFIEAFSDSFDHMFGVQAIGVLQRITELSCRRLSPAVKFSTL